MTTRAGAAVEGWFSDEEGHQLLPGLDLDTALRCLAFVPSYLYPLLASLNKTYRSLIISARCAPLMELRRTLGIVDHLLISKSPEEYETVSINGVEQYMRVKTKWSLRVLDLKWNTWLNLAVPRYVAWHHHDTFFCSGEGNLYVRNGGLISMGSDKLLVVGEWRPRIKEDEKKTYVLSWEASPEAMVCEFKIL